MLRRFWFACVALALLLTGTLLAQDALNLPAALYILTNEGSVQRYGLGTEGIRAVTPAGAFVVDFGVAPDDRWLAYRTEAGLFLRDMHSENETALDSAEAGTPPLRGRGDTVAWEPGGAALAVTTADGARVYFMGGEAAPLALRDGAALQLGWSPTGRYLAAESEGGDWWIYRRDGAALALTSVVPAAPEMAWVGGDALVFAPADGGLVRMDLAQGNAQTALLDSAWQVALPALWPDGALLLLGRRANDSATEAGSGRLLALQPGAADAEPLADAPVELAHLRWMPARQILVKFEGGVFALVDPHSGQGFPLPVSGAVAYSWGPVLPESVAGAELPADGFFLAQPGADAGPAQVWRLPADGAPAAPLTNEEAGVTSFGVAADGQRLIYSSGGRLLLLRLDGSEPVEVAALAADGPAQPAFSPDGGRAAYLDGDGLWLVDLAAGAARQLAAGAFSAPAFAPDVNALLVAVSEAGGSRPALVDITSSEVIPLGAAGQLARWLPGGRVALYGPQAGISVASLQALDQPAALLPPLVAVDAVGLAGGDRLRLSLPAQTRGPAPLRVIEIDSLTGAVDRGQVFVGGYLLSPLFSPGATHVAGYRWRDSAGRGPLTLRELATGRQVTLAEPPLVWGFAWAQP